MCVWTLQEVLKTILPKVMIFCIARCCLPPSIHVVLMILVAIEILIRLLITSQDMNHLTCFKLLKFEMKCMIIGLLN